MATYIIGDIQGCYTALRKLAQKIQFHPARDRLWFVGDLVNRGPESLDTLRWIQDLGDAAICVLGNHDLYCLRAAYLPNTRKHNDTLQALFDAPDVLELLHWLRHRPLLHVEHDAVMVHAGLLPSWDIETAIKRCHEVEAALQNENFKACLLNMWGNTPNANHQNLSALEHIRLTINATTRMRFCTAKGALEFDTKGPLSKTPGALRPWFDVPNRQNLSHTIYFGHWSALGFVQRNNVVCLDTGYIWGGALTALRLEDGACFQVLANPDDSLPIGEDA